MKLSAVNWGRPHTLKRWLIYAAGCCIINIVIFLILNRICAIHFEMNDDYFIQNLLNGAYGDYYIFFQQSNVALNALIASLYKAIPAVNWYGVFNFGILLISASFTGAVIFDKFSLRIGIPLYLAVVPVYYGFVLLYFTFTTICYSVLVCAFVCLIYGFFAEQRALKRALYIISAVLLCLSILIRWEAVYTAAVYGALIILWLVFKYKKKALYAVLSVAAAFGAVGCFFAADQAYYASDEELSEYIRFNTARANLSDKSPLYYDKYESIFQEEKWSLLDTQMIKNFFIPDDEKYNAEDMEYIYYNMKPTRYNKDILAIRNGLLSTLGDYYFYTNICLLIFFVLAWITNKNIWSRILAILTAALPYLFYILFEILWRAIMRVTYPHFMMSIILLLILINQNKFSEVSEQLKNLPKSAIKPALTAAAVISAFAAVGCGNMILKAKWSSDEINVKFENDIEYMKNVFENMALNSDYAFVYTAPQSPLININYSYGIFDTIQKDSLKNIWPFGGWLTRSPAYNDFKERYNIDSLPDDLVNNDKLLYIATGDIFLNQYIMQKYGINIEYEEVIPLGHNLAAYKVKEAPAS